MAGKFICEEFEKGATGLTPMEMHIVLKDQKRLISRKEHPKGSPQEPLTAGEVEDKFRDCLEHTVCSYSESAQVSLLKRLAEMSTTEHLDVSAIVTPTHTGDDNG